MRACANCGVPLAEDQRYCLECGGRQLQARSQFLDRFTPAAVGPSMDGEQAAVRSRSANVTAIAGVGVLLLAMGVGVLIGRASDTNTTTAPPQVISVASAGAGAGATGSASASTGGGGGGSTAGTATEVPEEWSAGKSGYTVQLQTFSTSDVQASEVTAAKSAALSKGASGVGILLSSNYASLPADEYVVYAGDYSSEAQAKQALAKLKAKFPSAAVIHVSSGGSSGAGTKTNSSSSSSPSSSSRSSSGAPKKGGSGSATPKSSKSGESAEQKARNIPNVVTTG
jgi:hypothetical protein